MTKALLITGGSRGIGAATARLAAAAGYAVAVNYRERADAAEALVAGIAEAGGRAVALRADVAREGDVVRLFDEAAAALGPLTALVNSAGITAATGPVTSFEAAALERLFAVNTIGTLLCCREAMRRMGKGSGGQGGAIVNVSSYAAVTGGRAGSSAYAASKAAVDAFTKGFAREAAAEGIRVNVVRPGMTMTDMTDVLRQDPTRRGAVAATIPMNRIAEADEIAWPILWLLSDQASFISGAWLDAAGGGLMIGGPPD
jgi:NAD(P)-dependent dehydrogenase (short-subunit alcohol dehydrogenase family)